MRDCTAVAVLLDLSVTETRRAVQSFFDVILSEARKMPFNDERRIYYQELFNDYVQVWHIPFIGRIGPVYSRYLKWRENESKTLGQVNKEVLKKQKRKEDVEAAAERLFLGEDMTPLKKKKGSEMYNRIWMVGRNGKRSAHQVIPKNE